MVVMCLIVLVPFITGVHSVVILRLPGPILLMPPVDFALHLDLSSERGISGLIDITHTPGSKRLEPPGFRVIALHPSGSQTCLVAATTDDSPSHDEPCGMLSGLIAAR